MSNTAIFIPCDSCGATDYCPHHPEPVTAFGARVDLAVRCLKTGDGIGSRGFDSCFEQYDGALVLAALVSIADGDPALKATLAAHFRADHLAQARVDGTGLHGAGWVRAAEQLRARERAKDEIALRLASPKRSNAGAIIAAQADAAHLPLFVAANEPELAL